MPRSPLTLVAAPVLGMLVVFMLAPKRSVLIKETTMHRLAVLASVILRRRVHDF